MSGRETDHGHAQRRGADADDSAHDVLAAEAFAVPAPDPELRHRAPVVLPQDPTGIPEPHDVLAAEEFAMPAARRSAAGGAARLASARGSRWGVAGALGALGGLLMLRRRGR